MTVKLPVYPGGNFTSGAILCIRLKHTLLLYRIFVKSGFLKCLSGWSGFLSWIGRLPIKSGELGSMLKVVQVERT